RLSPTNYPHAFHPPNYPHAFHPPNYPHRPAGRGSVTRSNSIYSVCVFSLWCLDASRPWLCYWILHSLELLEEPVPTSISSVSTATVPTSISSESTGPGQLSHHSRCDVVLNPPREKLLSFLFSVKQPDGSFVMHGGGGEVDIRSAYCAASLAPLTNIMTPTLYYSIDCQNWEGGLGGVPGIETHGGYTFCGTAAVVILGKEHMLDLKTLLRWVASRQMRFEGWFQGHCNKLVDGCYSFWQAGLLPLLHRALFKEGKTTETITVLP
uniref:Farnesyltransferase, CAAX box, subunit beta n=1 Tax=Oncorhynchus tshawytscha TaxID=74940 RepID=A0A8C8IRB4_ONCTS